MESSSFRGLTCELTGKNSTGIFRLAPVFRIDPAKLEAVAETRLPRDVRGVTEYRLKVSRCGRELFTDTWVEDLPPFLNAAAMNKHLYPKDHSIRVLTELQPQGDALAGIILRSRLDNGSWQEHPVTGKKQVVEYPLEKTAEGRHVITFEALRNGKLRETREVEFFRHPEALYSVRADGVLLEKGKPFIPGQSVMWATRPSQTVYAQNHASNYGRFIICDYQYPKISEKRRWSHPKLLWNWDWHLFFDCHLDSVMVENLKSPEKRIP